MGYSLKYFIKGSSIYTSGQILTGATGFLLIPIYTRYLTPKEFGIVGLLEVILSLMAILFSFGVYPAQGRLFYDYVQNTKRLGEFLFSINLFLILTVTMICFMLTLYGQPLFNLFIKNESIYFNPLVIIIIWTVFFRIVNQLMITFYVISKKYAYSAFLQYIQSILIITFTLLYVVYYREGALGKVKGTLLGEAFVFIIFYWHYAKKFILKLNYHHIRNSLLFGMPIVFHLLAAALLNTIDRIILEKYVSLSEIGIYTLGYQIGMVMSILVGSINRAWTPNYYHLMEERDIDHSFEIRRAFYLWLIIIGAICLLGSLWSMEILVILTPETYHSAAKIAPIIIFSFFINGVYYFVVNPIFYFKKTKILPFITISAALINIALNILLIPRYGIFGSAYATVISFFYMTLISYIISRKIFDPEFDIIKILILILIISTPTLGLTLQEISLRNEIIKIAVMASFIISSIILFYDYLKPFLKYITKPTR